MTKKNKFLFVVLCIFSLYLLWGASVLTWAALKSLYINVNSKAWVRVPARLDWVTVKSVPDAGAMKKNRSKNEHYRISASYHYDYEEKYYSSDRLFLSGNFSSGTEVISLGVELEKIKNSNEFIYPYVNPQNPSESYVINDFNKFNFVKKLIFSALLWVLFVALIFLLKYVNKK